jgi:hypothetical protein
MRKQRESGWLKELAACWVMATLAILIRVLAFLPSYGETAAPKTESVAAAKPQCATRQLRMSCFRDESGS